MLTSRFTGFLRRTILLVGVLLVPLVSSSAQTAISTLAGSSPAIAAGNVDATGTAARFSAPASVAVDAAGNICAADTSNHKIRKVTAAGVVTALAGLGTAGTANGTCRYVVSASSVDGYAPGPSVTAGPIPLTPHTADLNRDGRLSLTELTRVIELFNTRAGTARTGAYHVATTPSEDGFAPGP